jgi:DNA-binding XRE family transcriptional regulator
MRIKGSASRNRVVLKDRSDHPIRLGNRTLSRRQLARLVGVNPTHIGMIFNGRRHPSIELAARIADTFDITLDELFQVLRQRVD